MKEWTRKMKGRKERKGRKGGRKGRKEATRSRILHTLSRHGRKERKERKGRTEGRKEGSKGRKVPVVEVSTASPDTASPAVPGRKKGRKDYMKEGRTV